VSARRYSVDATGVRFRFGRLGLAALVVVVLLCLPLVSSSASQIDSFSRIAAYAVAILGLTLVTGYCGQISIGHSAFVGIGAYTTVILVSQQGWSYLATIPVAALCCLIAGVLVGIPALRISGLYLAAVTLAVAAVFPTLIDQFPHLTGGPNGLIAENQMAAPSWFPFQNAVAATSIFHYYVILAVAALMFFAAWNLARSRFGRALVAIRDSPYSAASAGVKVSWYKVIAFAVSAAFAGVAGSLLMIQLPVVSDLQFELLFAILLVIGLIVGGRTTITGAVVGAIVVELLHNSIPNLIDSLHVTNNGASGGQLVGIVSGIGLIVFAFLLPDGMVDSLKKLLRRKVRVERPPPDGWERYAPRPSTADGPLAAGEQPTSTRSG
jgi:branched-chain amino acid transport system permease protein